MTHPCGFQCCLVCLEACQGGMLWTHALISRVCPSYPLSFFFVFSPLPFGKYICSYHPILLHFFGIFWGFFFFSRGRGVTIVSIWFVVLMLNFFNTNGDFWFSLANVRFSCTTTIKGVIKRYPMFVKHLFLHAKLFCISPFK